jgi:hypothetical protein
MAISLESIKRSVSGPPRIVIYGVPGIGKTTWAASAPAPIFIPIEDGFGDLDVPTFPKPNTFGEVLDCIAALANGDHPYQTVVLDSLDKLEPLLWADVCAQAGKKSIEDFGYGKGYVAAAQEWRNVLAGFDALRDRGMTVVLIAHSAVVRVEPPEMDGFDRYQMRLHKTAEACVSDWADCVLFANYKMHAIVSGEKGNERRRGTSDGTRVVHTNERAAWRAKNRYSLPDQMPLDWPAFQQAMTRPAAVAAVAS